MKKMQDIAEILGEILKPLLEISIFSVDSKEPIYVYNRFEALIGYPDELQSPEFVQLTDGRTVKMAVSRFDDDGEEYLIQFRADFSVFAQLQQHITQLMGGYDSIPIINWQQQILDAISTFTAAQNIKLEGLNRVQKRQLIFQLKELGLLDYKDATNFVAKQLKTSRATIYNYLNRADEMTKLIIHQVNSFTDKPEGGNPAGVVLDAQNLDDDAMKRVARELNYSETAFRIPDNEADFRLRYFTCNGTEVAFCGHSTVGVLYMLAQEYASQSTMAGEKLLRIKTDIGNIQANIKYANANDITVTYKLPKIKLQPSKFDHVSMAEQLDIPVDIIDISRPVMFEPKNKNIFVAIRSLNDLESVDCDFRRLRNFMRKQDIVSCVLVTNQTFNKDNDIHVRSFSPGVGVAEDPFTGSMLGGLTAYVHTAHLISEDQSAFRVEQGHFVKRPGDVLVQFTVKDKSYFVDVHAKAHHFFSTKIDLVKKAEEINK